MKVLGTVLLAGTILVAGNAAQAAQSTQTAPTSTAVATTTNVSSAVPSRSAKANRHFAKCRRSSRFNERRVRYGNSAILGGRCVTSYVRGVKLVSSYAGHSPSAGRATDVMINMSGSCRSGRKAGNKVARYFMKNSGKHRVQYIIWKNSIWQSYEKRKKPKYWRSMSRGGNCTSRHYDHVHVSYK